MNHEDQEGKLPPKSCTIERLVTMPTDVQKVLDGAKTATRRNGRYADIGEVMDLEDHHFVVDRVYRQQLGELTDADAKREGFSSLEEYKESILKLHPGMPWLPNMHVWVHEFSPVNNA